MVLYDLTWPKGTHPVQVEMKFIQSGGFITMKGKQFGKGLFHHFRAMESLIWSEDYHNRWTDWMLKILLEERISVFGGSKDCVAAHTRIPNPITGDCPTIKELMDSGTAPTVMTIEGPAKASVPFIHGEGTLYEVTCGNGSKFTGSLKHFVLSERGFVPLGSLSLGQAIYSVGPESSRSTSELCLSIRAADDRRCNGKAQGSRRGYRQAFDSCDAPLLKALRTCQWISPSPACVPLHSQYECKTGVTDNGVKRSLLCPLFFRLSNEDYEHLESVLEMADPSPPSLGIGGPGTDWFPQALRSSIFSRFCREGFGSNLGFFGRRSGRCVDSWPNHKGVLTTVQSIKPAGEGKFFDLTVPGVGHYFAEGVIHHNSGKTRRVSKWALMDYWCFPETTLILMTSTTTRGLELRVYGDIKSLWERGTNRFPFLAGNPLDSKHGIFTDLLDDSTKVRDMRKGIIGIPTMTTEGAYDGSALIEFAGIKQVRRRLIGDEMQHIVIDYLKVLYAMDDGEFKAGFLGNMIADNGKALDRVAEPENGWGSEGEIKKTTAWRNKYGGVTLNLVGIDSPNLDPETKNQFPGMIKQESIDRAAKLPGAKDSIEWWSVIMGVRKAGAVSNRVLTVAEIERYGGFKECIWEGSDRTRIYSIDAGFGGDPCVRTWLEFGQEVHGQQVIQFGDQKVIPILLSAGISSEKQIAQFAKADCDTLGIPYENVFFDAGMYATLAVEMARELSPSVNAVNFGGTATERPVGNDMMVFDQKLQTRRPKTWYEHVSKFVTELHFVVRLLAQCRQLRKFPREAAEEFGRREWRYVYGDRYELETKAEYKVRYPGESPNHADSLVIGVEGARRLGFSIENMPDPNATKKPDDDYLQKELNKYQDARKKMSLSYK